MKTIIIVAAILLLALGLFAVKNRDARPAYQTPAAYQTPDTDENPYLDQIRVTAPKAGDSVKSPLTISGEARGNWYFEASFPVRLLDANGQVLAEGPAQAEGEWMTADFVPFKATLTFSAPTTPTGTLVVKNDNPSGLPENDKEIRIPLSFSQVSTQTKAIKLYFYNSALDKDASGNILCSAQGLVAFNRTIPLTNTPIQDAVKELLKGPSASEKAQASGTEFPLAGASLTSASLSNSVLTLTFADPQNKTSGGSCRVSVLKAQIEATAKQFGGVSSVRFMPSNLFQP